MNFQDMGWPGYFWLVVGVVLVLLGVGYLIWGTYIWWSREGRDPYFVERDLGKALAGFVIFLALGCAMFPLISKGNTDYQQAIAESRMKAKAEEEAAGARYAELEKAKADIQTQGLVVLAQDFESNGGGRIWMEINGNLDGCTYQAFVLTNPRGKYVLNLDSVRLYKNNPTLVFPEDGGNAYTPECPSGLDL